MTLISSQRYLDDDIIDDKVTSGDFEVLISPEFVVDGGTYCVVLDGHHSLAAAKQVGVEPTFITADCTDHDAVWLLMEEQVEDFLLVTHMGDQYYNIATGKNIW